MPYASDNGPNSSMLFCIFISSVQDKTFTLLFAYKYHRDLWNCFVVYLLGVIFNTIICQGSLVEVVTVLLECFFKCVCSVEVIKLKQIFAIKL